MLPIEFPEQNMIFAKYQLQYHPLPAFRDEDGQVISCWKLNLIERFKILFTGKLWLQQLTFNDPLQPQRPQVEYPFK